MRSVAIPPQSASPGPDLLQSRQLTLPDVDDPEGLKAAFQLFNALSSQLSDSYSLLEKQVASLNEELDQVQELRQQEIKEKHLITDRFQNLLNLLPGGVVVLDRHGIVNECNPAAIDLLGEPLLGQLWLRVIERCFAPRSDDGHEISLKDGRRINIATRSLDDEPGQIILLTDQTETRKLQQRLSRHQRLSEMGRMMSSLAHQLRTPLSAAMLYASHLSDTELTHAQVKKFSSRVLSRLHNLEQQINDMLIFVKGDVKLTEVVAATQLAEELMQAMDVALKAANARCELILDCKNAELLCNRQVMTGALLNLVNNALQACGTGASILCRVILQPDDRLCIAIEDHGPGMDEETLARIEEVFYTTKPQGTGLGLAVARAVARAHHGEFFIQSRPGQGTCSGMLLPVHGYTNSEETD